MTDPNGNFHYHMHQELMHIYTMFVAQDNSGRQKGLSRSEAKFTVRLIPISSLYWCETVSQTKMGTTFINHLSKEETTANLLGGVLGMSAKLTFGPDADYRANSS